MTHEDDSASREEGIESGIRRLEERRRTKAAAQAEGKLHGQKARGGAERLLIRTLSGAVYAILILACLYIGALPTAIIVALMAWLNCSEFFRMARMAGRMPNEAIGLAAAALFPVVALLEKPLYLFVAVLVLIILSAIGYVATPRATIADVALTVFGPIYTSLMYASIVLIRSVNAGDEGALLTFGVMGSVWLNDAVAYFVGSRFGRHKLAPHISPHKSIEGFWGGLAGGMIAWLILAALHVCGMTFVIAVPTGLAVGIASVVGDLFESRIKRGVGVKDSGNLIPGHGGMLDRSDSMLFAGTVACLALLVGGIL